MKRFLIASVALFVSSPAIAQTYEVTATAEGGFLSVLNHRIQFGQTGTYFDYDDQGAQDILFRTSRLSVDLRIRDRHEVTVLYQPLSLRTRTLLSEDLVVYDATFPAGTQVDLTYDFPFYRGSYTWDVAPAEDLRVSLGGGLQIRNARIEFASVDGTQFRSNRNVGPVPLLKARIRKDFGSSWWAETEVDGMYAPVSYLNGDDNDVVGAILDASVRAGVRLPRDIDAFANVRYLGGGATGTDDDSTGPGDGYTKNWLNFLTVTAGIAYTF